MHTNAFDGIQKQDMAQTNDAIYISNDWRFRCYWKHKIIRSKICACETSTKLEPFALKITTLFYSSAPINRCPLFQHSRRKLVKFGNNRRILTWMTHFDMKNTTKLDQTISSNFLPQGRDVRNIRTYDEMLPDRSFRSSKLIHENPVSRSRKRINRGTVYSLENKIASSTMAFVMSIMGWDSNRWRRRWLWISQYTDIHVAPSGASAKKTAISANWAEYNF